MVAPAPGFQSTVRLDQGYGIVGELKKDGPTRVSGYTIAPGATAANCLVGNVFTLNQATNTVSPGVALSASIIFAGILCNPKVYASAGSSAGTLAPTLQLPPGSDGEFMKMGFVTVVSLTAAMPGYVAAYDNTTGAISAYAAAGDIPGTSTQIPNAVVDDVAQANAPGLIVLRLTN